MATSSSSVWLYQIVDGDDLFTHDIFDDFERAKTAALELQERRRFSGMQINRIPMNKVGHYSEEMHCVWTTAEGDGVPADNAEL